MTMVKEENWASFHQKFCSDEYRRSADSDRSLARSDRKSVVGKLVKQCSNRKLSLEEELMLLSRTPSSRSISRLNTSQSGRPTLTRTSPGSSRSILTSSSSSLNLSLSSIHGSCGKTPSSRKVTQSTSSSSLSLASCGKSSSSRNLSASLSIAQRRNSIYRGACA